MAAVPRVEGTSVAVDASRTERPGDTANWHYLTGSIPAVSVVAEAVGFRWRCDSAQKQFLHPAGLVFLTKDGSVSSYLPGLDYRPGDVGLAVMRAAGDTPVNLLAGAADAVTRDRSPGRDARSGLRLLQFGAADRDPGRRDDGNLGTPPRARAVA